MAIRHYKLGAASFQDAAGTLSVTFGPGEGNFAIDELEAGDVEATAIYNRGTFLQLVEGQDKAPSWSITVLHNETLTNGASARIFDAVRKTGAFASKTTADPGGLVWTGNVILTVTHNGSVDTFTLNNCRLKVAYAEAKEGNTLTLSGIAYGLGGSARPVVVASV